MTTRVELLAPARDLTCGRAAIDCGADAVYIGAPRFGAREKAGNTLADIAELARYAHTYWARVYVTLNTLLRDSELPFAVHLAHQLYEFGVDALIIQDVGLLMSDLPPLPLIASTQMHNHIPERVAFLEQVGFRRAILSRELSLEQIAAIRRQTSLALECFIHGSLCVSYSGQCYMSYAIGGRSGNRGTCAQPCRRRYDLVDGRGQTRVAGRYLLSLCDLNLSAHLGDLLDVGVRAFKIEGRLKDVAYVKNVVSFYRRRIDAELAARDWSRTSSGDSQIAFEPDVHKTFNRGYTAYFLHGRQASPGSIDTPKMVGQFMGEVVSLGRGTFTLDREAPLHNGDGICYFDDRQVLQGTLVNGVQGARVKPAKMGEVQVGIRIYRNHDHQFLQQLEKSHPQRNLVVRLTLQATPQGLALTAVDEDGNQGHALLGGLFEPAHKPQQAERTAREQLAKMGDTPFVCTGIDLEWSPPLFVPVSQLNALRRDCLDDLSQVRKNNRPRMAPGEKRGGDETIRFPEQRLTYLGNVLNQKAEAFYRRHGVTHIEPAAESGLNMSGRQVMRTRYCILHELGQCLRLGEGDRWPEPLFLVDEEGHRYRLRFDCAACEMTIEF